MHGEASCEDSADKQTIFIENICARGIKFRSDQLFEMEQILTITVPLDGDCFVLLGRVCHSSQDSSEAVTGVQFVDVDPGFVRKVGQLCAAIGQGPELVFV